MSHWFSILKKIVLNKSCVNEVDGAQLTRNVVATYLRPRRDAMTSRWRRSDVATKLCVYWLYTTFSFCLFQAVWGSWGRRIQDSEILSGELVGWVERYKESVSHSSLLPWIGRVYGMSFDEIRMNDSNLSLEKTYFSWIMSWNLHLAYKA